MFVFVIMMLLVGLIGYLLGSLNFAIILSKLIYKKDIRNYGSKNAGMTNVLRTFDIKIALLTLIGDFSKGIFAVVLSRIIVSSFIDPSLIYLAEVIAAFCAFLGHVYPLYYKFKGGKGILVSAGSMLIIDWVVFLIVVAIFILFFLITKIISVGSITAAVSYPIVMGIRTILLKFNPTQIVVMILFSLLTSMLILYLHRGNIKRLINHQEPKVGR